jgi:hypothetical protein
LCLAADRTFSPSSIHSSPAQLPMFP